MPRILLLAALFLIITGCLLDGSDADSAPEGARSRACETVGGAPDAAALPTGHRLAWAEGVKLWALTDACDSPQLLREHREPIREIRWSPDGDAIALQDGKGTTVVHLHAALPPRSFGSEEFAWLDDYHLLIGRSRLPVEPRTETLVVVDVTSGDEQAFDGAHTFAVQDGFVAFWQDAGACPPEALPPDQLKPGGTPIERRCPRLVVRAPGEEQPALRVDVGEMLAAMPEGVPSMGLTSPGSIDWSPNGDWIVFRMCGIAASGCVDTQHMFEVHVGSGVVTYVGDTSGAVAWAPDGAAYVYVREGGRSYDAYPRPLILRRAGTSPAEDEVRSPTDFEDVQPQWSPDGVAIAFTGSPSLRTPPCLACPPEDPEQGIWVVIGPGAPARRHQLTHSPDWVDTAPQWSSDGGWILFERRGPEYIENEGYAETQLWLMRPDGANQHMVADLSSAGPSNVPFHSIYDWWTPPD